MSFLPWVCQGPHRPYSEERKRIGRPLKSVRIPVRTTGEEASYLPGWAESSPQRCSMPLWMEHRLEAPIAHAESGAQSGRVPRSPRTSLGACRLRAKLFCPAQTFPLEIRNIKARQEGRAGPHKEWPGTPSGTARPGCCHD